MSAENESAIIEGIVNTLPTDVIWFKKRCRYLMEGNARFVEFLKHNWNYITGKHKIGKSCNDEANLWAVFTELEFACMVLLHDRLDLSFVPEISTSTPDFHIYTDDGYEFYAELKRFGTTNRESRLHTTLKEIEKSIRCIPSNLNINIFDFSFDGLDRNSIPKLLELDRQAIIYHFINRIRSLDNALSPDDLIEEKFSTPNGIEIELHINKPSARTDNNSTRIDCVAYPILYSQNEHLNIVDVILKKVAQLAEGKANVLFVRAENDSYETSDAEVAINILTSFNDGSDRATLESKLNKQGITIEDHKHNLSILSALVFRNNSGNTECRTFFWTNPNAVPELQLPDWISEHLRTMTI
jgi:hypothetical protein